MRSRYSAYFAGQRAYLLTTWHPAGRPARLDLDPALRWLGLEILATTGGSPFHTEGTVTFRARGARGTTPYILEEHSRFVRYQGAWVYLDALPTP
jgi:SEC-C motif-containing protein